MAEINLELVRSSNKLFAYTVLTDMPADPVGRLELYEALLNLNCLEIGTGDGVLSLERRSGKILYQKEIPLVGLGLATLEEVLHAVSARSASLAETLKKPIANENKSITARSRQTGLQHQLIATRKTS